MDAGNAAQWAAVATALALGIRAEVRAVRDRRREHAREEGAAFARLTEFLGRAVATLPADISNDAPWTPEILQPLLDANRNAVEPIAGAFPGAARDLLTVSEQLEAFAQAMAKL